MRKRNKLRNFKKQDDEFEFSYEHTPNYLAWIEGFQKNTQKVDELLGLYEMELGI